MQRWILCCPYLPIFGNRLCTSSALFDLMILFAASLKIPLQYRWWHLDVLADDHDSNWMWWSEVCRIKPKLSKIAELIHDMCTPPVLIWSFCLCPYNHEKINTSSVQSGGGQQSFALKCKSCREIFDSTASYSQLERRLHRLAQGTGRADPSNMAELTFQPRGDMATGILLELDILGETLEQWFSLFFIILHYSLRNNEE